MRRAATFAIGAVVIGILSIAAHYWLFVNYLAIESAIESPGTLT